LSARSSCWGAQAASLLVVGSLPTTISQSEHSRLFWRAAKTNRLAACAPQIQSFGAIFTFDFHFSPAHHGFTLTECSHSAALLVLFH
jgi:hypothetical protein